VKNFSLNFRIFFESENFQNLKMIESKKNFKENFSSKDYDESEIWIILKFSQKLAFHSVLKVKIFQNLT
jgi:hypothetical protein